MRLLTDTAMLTRRALRETMRQPANELANIFIPLFFFVVTVGAVGEVAKTAFGVSDYKGFQLPVAILQGAAGVAGGSGLAMTTDIQSGYFEKLLLTSTPRFAIVFGRMFADAIKAMNMFLLPQINVPILGVVENMAWFTPAELPHNKYFIFGQGGGKKLALESRSVLLGQIPIVQSIREGGGDEKPAMLQTDRIVSEAFLNVAKNTLRQVAVRNETLGPTQVVQMVTG